MYLTTSFTLSLAFMIITMVFWGSWANTIKIDTTWRFELLYWDFSIALFLVSFLFAITLGSLGDGGRTFWQNLASLNAGNLIQAISSGVLFDLANFLLISAVALAGMSVAFPIGIGIASVFGTIFSYFVRKKGNPYLLFAGVAILTLAIVITAIAQHKREQQKRVEHSNPKKGVWVAVICGILMSFFYPILADSMNEPNPLTPYTAFFFFALGSLAANFVFNYWFMRRPFLGPPLKMRDYFQGTLSQHLIGLFGGALWAIGLGLNLIASTDIGPAIAWGLAQGATLVAAIWGVFIWKEFKGVKKTNLLLWSMFVFYFAGLVIIALARFH